MFSRELAFGLFIGGHSKENSSLGYHHVVWGGKTKHPSPKGLFVVLVTWQGSHVGGHCNKQFFEEFALKRCLLPRGEKHLCSWSPSWPPWRHVQTSNSWYQPMKEVIMSPKQSTHATPTQSLELPQNGGFMKCWRLGSLPIRATLKFHRGLTRKISKNLANCFKAKVTTFTFESLR